VTSSRAARAIATACFALLLLLSACTSSSTSSSGAGADTFCTASKTAAKTCQDASECDGALTAACNALGSVVSSSTLTAARDCLESGVCGAASCLSRAQKSAVPGTAHKQLAADFCSSCAPDVADCETAFYQRGKKLPGTLVLPYADAVVSAIDAQCTGTSGCQATFAKCVNDVTSQQASASLDPGVADCVVQGFTSDGATSAGPDGAAQVAKCTPANCNGCCRDDKCLDGTTTDTCGTGAAGCQICGGQQKCTAGQCKEPCGPNNCAGCCDGDTCVAGNANDKCGGSGEACTSCGASLVCSNKQCIDASCQATCTNGCCSDTGCQPGTASNACGTGGVGCVDCGYGRSCTSGACVLDTTSLWDFYVSFAVLPELSKSGYHWDALGGLPDPYLVAFSSEGASSHSGITSTVTDSLYPFWAETPLTGVKASELLNNLSFEVWDEDTLDADDLIGGCKLPLTAAMFDGSLQDYTCAPTASSNSVKLYFRINPHQ
jgi:hypothetical protein